MCIRDSISTIRTYVAAGFSQEEAVQAVKTEVHEPVTKVSSVSASSDLVPYTYYFRYIPYLFLGALCYTMGYILMAFKKGDIAVYKRQDPPRGNCPAAQYFFHKWTDSG